MDHVEDHLARELAFLTIVGILNLLIEILEYLILDLSRKTIGFGRGTWPCPNAEVWRIVQAFKRDMIELIFNPPTNTSVKGSA